VERQQPYPVDSRPERLRGRFAVSIPLVVGLFVLPLIVIAVVAVLHFR
jgi:hypothetical protein